jgi:dTDP-glucose 4,6-dehydratase
MNRARLTGCARSPYSASKTGSDLIPLMIMNAMADKPLPIYGDDMQVCDWLFVDDHCRAILAVLGEGREGSLQHRREPVSAQPRRGPHDSEGDR